MNRLFVSIKSAFFGFDKYANKIDETTFNEYHR